MTSAAGSCSSPAGETVAVEDLRHLLVKPQLSSGPSGLRDGKCEGATSWEQRVSAVDHSAVTMATVCFYSFTFKAGKIMDTWMEGCMDGEKCVCSKLEPVFWESFISIMTE